jgi:hypothetical protein
MTEPRIRKAVEADVCNLLPLMRELAEFEKYASDFAITEEGLREQGFRRSPPDFHCLIAESGGELVGFLVYYFVALHLSSEAEFNHQGAVCCRWMPQQRCWQALDESRRERG